MSQLVYFKESVTDAAFCVPPFANFVAPPEPEPRLESLPVFPCMGGTNQKPYAFAFGLQGTKFFWQETPYSEFIPSGPAVIQWYDLIGLGGQGKYVRVSPFLLAGEDSGFLPLPPASWSVRTDTMGASEIQEWIAPSTVGAPVFGGGSTSFTIYVSVTVKTFDHFEFIGENHGTEIVGPKLSISKDDAARILAVYVEKTTTTHIRVIPKGKIPKTEWPQRRHSIAKKVVESLQSQGIKVAEKAALAGIDSLKTKFVAR